MLEFSRCDRSSYARIGRRSGGRNRDKIGSVNWALGRSVLPSLSICASKTDSSVPDIVKPPGQFLESLQTTLLLQGRADAPR